MFEPGTGRTDVCVGLSLRLGQVARVWYVYGCVYVCLAFSLGQVARINECVRVCEREYLSLGQVARTQARARV